ncbi:geranylgeranyl reductase family protein [Allobranchiibius sp. GilTou73]|uniref:geranylgeranyl reductase family protein n=1 Tax=Allobranchiibius sp. GilTou73 TaxID=2904523 RepID=UPI001F2416E4|nr:geranylgeranyl reductase family protein [Allobranchiibius sp. GilTou73]UIJ36033.1 geranylgeranyl reductase family protein [Allobranchiibius sp. GilTou73]
MSQSLSGGALTTSAPETADVIVVGAGPGGSSVAAYLAMAGLDVLLLEKTHFPREKVCGDGLTPRAVRELVSLGIPMPEDDGWIKNKGLRIIGGGMRLQLDWPDNASFPPYGLVRTRQDFDDILARHAVKQGAQLRQGVNVVAPVRGANGHIVGVEAKEMGVDGRATGATMSYRAPLVIAADGNSSRLSLAMGREKREDRPMGVAVRAYYTSPRHDDDYLESWLELWSKDAQGKRVLLPGYGWIFGVGDGTSNVGLGILNTSSAFGKTDYKEVMRQWVATMPQEWTYNEETITGPIKGAALPMGFNRQPHYADGLLLVGDAGGMVNPFNGEGIAYAMESARLAAEVVAQAFARTDDASRERVLLSYPQVMRDALGGYYTLGRMFAKMIGNPDVMRLAVKYGLPRKTMMQFLLKVMANLGDTTGGRIDDRALALLSRMTPAA